MQPDGNYKRLDPGRGKKKAAQMVLLDQTTS